MVNLELPDGLRYMGSLVKITGGLSEGQVLQRRGTRGADVVISGESKLDGAVTATISQTGKPLKGWKDREVGASAKGHFKITLKDIPTGGLYSLKLSAGAKSATIRSFYVGDVWLLAGQSNMQGVGDMNGAAKPDKLIRVFTMGRVWQLAEDPLHVLGESPDIVHNDGLQFSAKRAAEYRANNPKGVGPGMFFAREMLARTGVPQGLIATAHGGTSMAQWNPDLRVEGGRSLYYSMLESAKATGQPVAGVLWYQGESDAMPEPAPKYTAAMKKLVATTRRDLRAPTLPWVTVQIGRYIFDGIGKWWNVIREEQRKLPAVIRHLETVPTIDLPLDDGIHIGSDGYVELGKRMASAAARLVLGQKELRPPQLRKIHSPIRSRYGWYQDVEFESVQGALTAGSEPRGFAYVDAEHKVSPRIHRISLRGKVARLHIGGDALDGIKLGYGLGFDPACNITDSRGISLPAFGPLTFNRARAMLPFVMTWRKTELLPVQQPLDRLPCVVVKGVVKTYEGGFVNENAEWRGKAGQVYFSSVLKLPEAMKLRFFMGYDGPFRMWVDGKSFFTDMNGINPCIADESSKLTTLSRGQHVVTVAMDTNEGCAWGFFLRFERMEVSAKDRRDGTFSRPEYLV